MDIDKLEKIWIERGFSFAVGTIKAGDSVDKAFHDDKDELVLMEKGHYEFILNDEVFLQQGEIEVTIPSGTTHSIKNLGSTNSTIYYGYRSKL